MFAELIEWLQTLGSRDPASEGEVHAGFELEAPNGFLNTDIGVVRDMPVS
jgi:hypothetical protein